MKYYIANSTFYQVSSSTSRNELYHYGVPGMKWEKRKTPEIAGTGRLRRAVTSVKGVTNRIGSAYNRVTSGSSQTTKVDLNTPEAKAARVAKAKRAVKIGAAVAGTALAAYGAYKVSKALKNKAYTVAHARGVKAASKFMEGYKQNNSGPDAIRRASNMGRYLSETNHDYAARSSKTTAAAVKTLLGKNYEMPVAELWNMGINTPRFK